MRIVIDTNVFISGVFWKGTPADILHAWRTGRLEIVLSPAIIEEYQRVGLELADQFPSIDLAPIIEALAIDSLIVPDRALPEPVCTDPSDDKFLASAVMGRASFVITGDRALLRVREYHGIQVVSPRLFASTHLVEKGA